MKAVKAALKHLGLSLARSKKFAALLAGLGATLAVNHLGLDPAVAEDLSTKVVGLVMAYLLGQGVADHGKEKAIIEGQGFKG